MIDKRFRNRLDKFPHCVPPQVVRRSAENSLPLEYENTSPCG